MASTIETIASVLATLLAASILAASSLAASILAASILAASSLATLIPPLRRWCAARIAAARPSGNPGPPPRD
jgi:hypothetical protein